MPKTATPQASPRSARREGGTVPAASPLAQLAAEVASTSTVVLDTSVLMADPEAFHAYEDADVVIPLTVIDELDHNKTRRDEAGRNARTVLRHIEDLRLAHDGDIATPVALPGGGTLRIEPNGLRLEELSGHHLDPAVPDHRIIAAALGLAHDGRAAVRVVSNDAALRIKAATLGLSAAEHTPGKVGMHAPHRTGLHTLEVSYAAIERAKAREPFALADLPEADRALFEPLLDNEFALLKGTAFIVRRVGQALQTVNRDANAWGLEPRNKEQACALDLLMDEQVSLVALRGHAGTGKTLTALAAGLEQVFETGVYDKLMVLRPMVSVGGQDMGFLPGDVAEKTQPWFKAVVDAMVALAGGRLTEKKAEEQLSLWVEQCKVAMDPITFMRGRSLTRTYVILDEAQNVEPSVVKTVISRLGAGSKLVINGDDGQIDTAYVSSLTCGLNVAVDAFAGVDLFGQVFFTKGERSRLADLAAERL